MPKQAVYFRAFECLSIPGKYSEFTYTRWTYLKFGRWGQRAPQPECMTHPPGCKIHWTQAHPVLPAEARLPNRQKHVNHQFRPKTGSPTPALRLGHCSSGCSSPLPGLLLFLFNDGTAPGRDTKALSTRPPSAACRNTHTSIHNNTFRPLWMAEPGLGWLPRQPACFSRWSCAPKSGLLPVSAGLGHDGIWRHIFYFMFSSTRCMGLPGHQI